MKKKNFSDADCIDLLYNAAITLTGVYQIDKLYSLIVAQSCLLTQTENGFLYVFNEENEMLEVKCGTGAYSVYKGARRSKKEPSVSSTVWRTGRPLVVDSLADWEGHAVDRPYGWDIIKSVLGIPLYSGIEVVAVIGLRFSDQQRRFNLMEIDLLSRFAALASLALYNAKRYQNPAPETAANKMPPFNTDICAQHQINQYCSAPSCQDMHEDFTNPGQLAREIWKTAQFQVVDASAASEFPKQAPEKGPCTYHLPLTDREQTILTMLADGASNQEIACILSVAMPTVKAHISHIFAKLGVKRRVQAIIIGRQQGLL